MTPSKVFVFLILLIFLFSSLNSYSNPTSSNSKLSSSETFEDGLVAIGKSTFSEPDGSEKYQVVIRLDGLHGASYFDTQKIHIEKNTSPGDSANLKYGLETKMISHLAKISSVAFNAEQYSPIAIEACVLSCFGKVGWEVYFREEEEEYLNKNLFSQTLTIGVKREN